jgi:hypothetical protein
MKITLKHKALALMVASALLAGSSAALAAKPANPGGGGGGGGGGGNPGGEETAAQNLSVPTIMVGGAVGGLLCGTPDAPSTLVPPTGTPQTGYEVPGYFWVQKVHTWQAQCFNDVEAVAFGAWGDNLAGDAKLKVGSPIRVEIVLQNLTEYSLLPPLQGYTVSKLEPSKLDRESAYGHSAGSPDIPPFPTDFPVDFASAAWLVHDAGITFSVLNLDTGTYAVPPGTSPTAEINATGKVVYGYNLRVGVAGPYRIQFTSSPLVTFNGVDAGGQIDDNNVYIDIDVVTGGGGGGKKGGKP